MWNLKKRRGHKNSLYEQTAAVHTLLLVPSVCMDKHFSIIEVSACAMLNPNTGEENCRTINIYKDKHQKIRRRRRKDRVESVEAQM